MFEHFHLLSRWWLDPHVVRVRYLPGEKINSQVNQSKPDHTKWSIWFKFTARITRRNQRVLKQPLGDWIVDYWQIRKTYISYCTSTYLYKCKKDRIQTWGILNMAGIEWTGMMKEEVNSIPAEAIPCLQSYTGLIYTSYNKASSSYNHTSIQEISNNPRSQIRGQTIKGDFTRKWYKRRLWQLITKEN